MFILLPFMYFYYEEREEEATWKTVRQTTSLSSNIVVFED